MHDLHAVITHELEYFYTLKQFKKSILIQCLAPSIFLLLFAYFYRDINFNFAIVIMVLGIPRIPMSLTGYSIAGEKVYKTFESILSTPVSTKSLFLGKAFLPFVIAIIMFFISSMFVLITANAYSMFFLKGSSILIFSNIQLMLIFGNGLLVATLIIFITGLSTMLLKTARNGLFLTSMIIFLFSIPHSLIMFYAENQFLFSSIYFLILFLLNFFCYFYVIKKLDISVLFIKSS